MNNVDSKPLVTVGVPTFKQAEYLPACLDGIWFQDYPNLEIVVVNAASPDNTRAVLAKYEEAVNNEVVSFASHYDERSGKVVRTEHERYPKQGRKLKIINLEEDPGLSETYNISLREGEGELVTTIVSDDVPLPGMVSRLVTELDKGFDFAYSDVFLVEDNGSIVRKFAYPDYDPVKCLANWYLMGSSKLWRRKLHQSAGWFDPNYPMTQDYELFLRFAMAGASISHVPEVLYNVRFHGPERKTGNHSPEREPKIFTESIEIAMRARKWLTES